MLQLIVFIIFLISVIVVCILIARKLPVLVTLPQNSHHGFKKHRFIIKIENQIKDMYFHFFERQMLLHKLLSLIKVLTLKIETKIDTLLHRIRKKAQYLDKTKKRKP